jgi:uncharacterized membrane protein
MMVSEKRKRLFKLERMLAFSDGVFAVVITLLVLDLRLPELPSEQSTVVLSALLAMWPKLLIFCFTFVIVGMCWIEHHRKFSMIHQIDNRLMWLNITYLMILCLVPFGTNVFSEHSNHFAFAFYALIMTFLNLLSAVLSFYALRPPYLADPTIHPYLRSDMILSPLSSSAIFLASTVLAAVGAAGLAHWILLLMIPASAYTGLRAERA